jgi:hypothetical protein
MSTMTPISVALASLESAPGAVTPEFVAMGTKRFDELAKMQGEFFERLQEANRVWVDRVQKEVVLRPTRTGPPRLGPTMASTQRTRIDPSRKPAPKTITK